MTALKLTMKARRDADHRDAERYRWMREHVSEIVWHQGPGKVGNLRKEYTPGKLDEWVDEGMSSSSAAANGIKEKS